MWRTEFEGRLGKDPEMRYLSDGRPVTNFRVAVNWNEKDEKKRNGWAAHFSETLPRRPINY